jgi:hypothetical protein
MIIDNDMRDDAVERACFEFSRGMGLSRREHMLASEMVRHVLAELDRLDVLAARAAEQTDAALRDIGFG